MSEQIRKATKRGHGERGYTDESPSITAAIFRTIAESEHSTVVRRS